MTTLSISDYFDTPERTERLQLVAHLLRNAELVPYVRGPVGAGKSRFAEQLADSLKDEATVVSLDGGHCDDVPAAICEALGLMAGEWPAVVLDGPTDNPVVVLVDDADRLVPQAQDDLLAFEDAGGRVVLLGCDDPAALSEAWRIQLIDLPPLTEAQARDFLALAGGVEAALLTDAALHRLHQQSGGQPGLLLAGPAGDSVGSVGEMPAGPPWKWLLGGAAAVLVILVLWQQERINALFSPPQPAVVDVQQVPEKKAAPAENLIAIPPLPATPAPAAVPSQPPETQGPETAALQDGTGVDEARVEVETGAQTAVETAEPVDTAVMPAPESVAAGEQPPAEPAPELIPQLAPEAPLAIVRAPEPAPVEPEPAEPLPLDKLVQPLPATTSAAADAPAVAAPPAPKPVASPKPAQAPKAAVADDLAWLRARQPDHYTLQLLGARDRTAIDQFIRTHRLKGKYAVFARDLNGEPWYSLVYGDYPDRDAALRGRSALPGSLRGASVWPRTFASVWEQLPAVTAPR